MRFLSIPEPCGRGMKALIIIFLLFVPPLIQAASCININTAPREDLEKIRHIGESRAEQILKLRQEKLFPSLDELENVKGIGPARIADIKEQGLACVKNSEPEQEVALKEDFKENLAQIKTDLPNPLLLLLIGLIVAIFSGFVILLLRFFIKKEV